MSSASFNGGGGNAKQLTAGWLRNYLNRPEIAAAIHLPTRWLKGKNREQKKRRDVKRRDRMSLAWSADILLSPLDAIDFVDFRSDFIDQIDAMGEDVSSDTCLGGKKA